MSDNTEEEKSETLAIVEMPKEEPGENTLESLPAGDSTHSSPAKADNEKIDILLKATGNAPIMKKRKWAVSQDKQISSIILFIKNYLKLDASESLFLYVNQAFAPSPDQIVKNLYDCYGIDGKLVLHYCKSQAWG